MARLSRSPKNLPAEAQALAHELASRRARDASYSSRAFAQDLGLSPSMLCRVLQGSKQISTETALRLAARMPWSQRKRAEFISAVRDRQDPLGVSVTRAKRSQTAARTDSANPKAGESLLGIDAFATVAGWEHAALLELFRIPGIQGRVNELAQLLRLPAAQVREALERLARLELVESDGKIWRRRTLQHLRVPDVPSEAIRAFHKAMLDKAWDAIDCVSPDARDVSGVAVATSPERIAGAKALVAKFRRDMFSYLEDCEPSVIYHVAVQMSPLSVVSVTTV